MLQPSPASFEAPVAPAWPRYAPRYQAPQRPQAIPLHPFTPTYKPALAPDRSKSVDCAKDDCGEEDLLDPAYCGTEDSPPKPEQMICGIDSRPLMPLTLGMSTVLGGLTMLCVELPMLARLMDVSVVVFTWCAAPLYAVTVGVMLYCAFADPGQLRNDRGVKLAAIGDDDSPVATASPVDLEAQARSPSRSHKSYLYKQPIRRYDHYCKWVNNCIGLLNHREFYMMLTGLVSIALFGTAVDIMLIISFLRKGFWGYVSMVGSHLGYSMILLYYITPIFQTHTGLISRNELAHEWKQNLFYVAPTSSRGAHFPARELPEDEYDALFDTFVYDKTRNPWDRGCAANWRSFWCTPRWPPHQQGDF